MDALFASLLLWQTSDLEAAAQKLADKILSEPDAPEELFHADFLKSYSAARLSQMCKQIHAQYGEVTSVELVANDSARSGVAYFVLSNETRLAANLTLEAGPARKITGLWFGQPRRVRPSFDDVVDDLKKLRGRTAFVLERIGDSPMTLADHDGGNRLAIGSTFKLCVLGALLSGDKDVWTKTVALREEHRSLPSGFLQNWKPGAPVTIHTLASLMISQSDNTAADHLLFHAGRERVEKAAGEMGLADPRNRPFLSTLEAFKLKSSAELRKQYLDADEAGRRKLLAGPVREMNRDAVDLLGPVAIDTIDWFASPGELCQAMDWLRRKTSDPAHAAALDVLSINPGLRTLRRAWKFVGYKGGSEPGVLNVTLLLQAAGGQWYALSAAWNDSDRTLDETPFVDLVQDAVYILQRR